MSVTLYSKNEIITMLASSWYHGSIGSRDGIERLERFAAMGNRIAAANAVAFAETYLEQTEHVRVTGAEVKRAIIGKTVGAMSEGYRTLRGIRYNLIANDGRDFATAEVLDDLLTLVSAQADRSMAA